MSNIIDESLLFPKIQETGNDKKFVTKEERYQYQCPIILRYLRNKIAGWSIGDFFSELETKKYVIYAITEFADLVCDDLAESEIEVKPLYICDKNYMKYPGGHKGYKVNGIPKLVDDYKKGEVEKILLCNILRQQEIVNELLDNEIKMNDIISITSAVFSKEL